MKCSRIKNLLSDYIDNILPENTKKEIDEHIKNCENCKHELELLQQSVTLCRQTETVPLPNYFEENLMDCIDSVAKRRWIFRINRPWIYSSAAAAVICIVFMWNFIYSTYMETKSSYNPPLTQNGSVSNRYSDDSELASGAANDENAENSEIPQETEDTANLPSPVVSEPPSAGNTDLTQPPENTVPQKNQEPLFGSAASVTAVPSPSPSSKIQAAPSPSNTAKIASDITENASDSSANERASGSAGGNGGGSSSGESSSGESSSGESSSGESSSGESSSGESSSGESSGGGSSGGGSGSYMMQAAPANASFDTSKSTFVAASNASDAISWINSNLQPLSTSSSRGYTIITLNENDFYKLKASASEFGATTADISENAPYASIIDHSGGYSAVIYNP